jgi:hypothetical protein
MLTIATSAAVVLYLLPVLVLFSVRARRDQQLASVALGIPLAVAADVLATLLLARLMLLETAVFVARVLWLVVGAVVISWRVRRGDRPRWPSSLGWHALGSLLLGATVGVMLSLTCLRPCFGADGSWHVPLSMSLLGQRAPFSNVYEPGGTLHYHYAGNVVAGAIRTLSFGVLHIGVGLAYLHTVALGLTGATLALLFRHFGYRSSTASTLAVLGVLLTGPFVLLRDGTEATIAGYNYINFLRLSMRPHVPLGGLLVAGYVGALLGRLHPQSRLTARATVPVLLCTAALLSLTDEPSLGLLGLATGFAWLVVPQVLAPKRWHGLLVLAALLAALVVAALLFPGALARGSQAHDIATTIPRSPGYLEPPIPLAAERGFWLLLHDAAPLLIVLVAGAVLLLRRVTRELLGQFVFFAVAVVISLSGLVMIEVDGRSDESHRFMTLAMILAPLLAALWLRQTSPWSAAAVDDRFYLLRPGWLKLGPRAGSRLVAVALASAVVLPAASTLQWVAVEAGVRCTSAAALGSRWDFFDVNCKSSTGAGLGAAAEPEYAERRVFYLYAGCRPLFASAPLRASWKMRTHGAQFGASALRDLHENMLPKDRPLIVNCQPQPPRAVDPVCAFATTAVKCTRPGLHRQRCQLNREQRQRLVEQSRQWTLPRVPSRGQRPGKSPAQPATAARSRAAAAAAAKSRAAAAGRPRPLPPPPRPPPSAAAPSNSGPP